MNKKLMNFLEPFIEKHPNYIRRPKSNGIFSTPMKHIFNGFVIRQKSTKTSYDLHYYIATLFDAPHQTANFSIEIGTTYYFSTLDSDYRQKLDEFMERWHLIMSEVNDVQSLISFASNPAYPHSYMWPSAHQRTAIHAAMGDFGAAKERIANSWPYFLGLSAKTQNSPGVRRYYEAHRDLELALDGDPRVVFQMLHEWEAINVRENGFEPYWTPTPFPGEIALGLAPPEA
jgi:hypothetical protein